MRYFQGDTLNGLMRPAPASNFKDLVDRLLSVPVPLNLTRAAYNALTPKERDKAKQVPFLTPARYLTKRSKRRTECAEACSLLFLDIDPPKSNTGTPPARIILDNLDVVEEQLAPWSFAIYHTASSTTDTPRLRVVVDADVPLDRYEDAVKTVAQALGLPRVTTESLVPVQAMYLPSLFSDEDPEEYQPLIASFVTGKRFHVLDISTSDVITERKSRTTVHSADGSSSDPLDFLRNPMDGITDDMVREMLECIDPDVEYREWLDVAAALRHQYVDDPETGFLLFDQWSAKGTKYAGPEETQAKWASFKSSPNGRVPVTLRSVMHRASLGGWDNGKVKQTQFEQTQQWLMQATDLSSLLSEGLNRVAATPMLSQSEEEGLLAILSKSSKRLGVPVAIPALRRDLQAMREAAAKEKSPDNHKQNVPAWVRGCCYVSITEQIFRHSTGEKWTLASWDSVYSKRLLPTEEQLERMKIDINMSTLSKPLILPRQFALNLIKIPAVCDYTYDPTSPNDIFVIDEGKAYVNTYRRCHPQPIEADAEEAGALFDGHLRVLIKEPEYRRILMNWLAYLVQVPGGKIRWSPLIQGAEGCGKTFLADTMSVVLGKPHVKPISGAQIFSGYTEWATGYQLIVLEEVRISGVNRHEVMNVLKPLVSNTEVSINQKYRDSRSLPNRTNYMLLTNHRDSLALNQESRRYFVLQSAIQAKSQVEKLKAADHFDILYDMLATKAGGLRAYFENWVIDDDFMPNASAPGTIYLDQLIEESANETTGTVRRLINEGDNPLVQHDLLSSKVLLEMLHDSEGLRKVTAQHLSSILREEGYVQITRTLINEERHYLWRHLSTSSKNWVDIARERHAKGLLGPTVDDIL